MKLFTRRFFFLATAMLVVALGTGCATRGKMAFEDENEKVVENGQQILLMSVTIRNVYMPRYQPKLIVVNVEKPNAKDAQDRLNFVMDNKGRDESNGAAKGNHYLIRMVLEPGQYEIRGMGSLASAFPFHGGFFTPLHAKLEVKGSGVVYLGHIDAVVRQRQGNEFRAGGLIPLLDQAVTGASGGTFDVTISDAFVTDEALFKERFPALRGVSIGKSILAPFDRAVAQSWWEKN